MGSGNGILTQEVMETLRVYNVSVVYTSGGIKLIGKTLPIEREGSIEYLIAKKCAEAFKVNLDKWDFGRGRDEWDPRWVFILEIKADSVEVKKGAESIGQAQTRLNNTINEMLTTLVLQLPSWRQSSPSLA